MSYRSAAIVLPLALLFTPTASHAQEHVHRCVGGDGQINFTDRSCEDLQMQERAPPPEAPVSIGGIAAATRSCARSRDDLLANVRNALELHDVNRLAGSYLWTGMGTREAYARMDRFRVVSARPLIDAQLPDDSADQIRIDQLHSAVNAESETSYFQIVPAAGCLWIHD